MLLIDMHFRFISQFKNMIKFVANFVIQTEIHTFKSIFYS